MRGLPAALAAALAALALAAPAAQAEFGLDEPEVSFHADAEGNPALLSGSHPYSVITEVALNTVEEEGEVRVDGALRDLDIYMPPGFAGDPTAMPPCAALDFLREEGRGCPDSAALGTLLAKVGENGLVGEEEVAIYNLRPVPGSAAKLGFWVGGTPIVIAVGLTEEPPYRIVAHLANTTQIVEVVESVATLWGNPADDAHDPDRGACAYPVTPEAQKCSADVDARPFLTMPRSCPDQLSSRFEATSWWSGEPEDPGPAAFFAQTSTAPGLIDCSALEFSPELEAAATTRAAASPSGLQADLRVDDEGLADPDGRAASDIRKAVVALPEGMTINPSQAEGLKTCSEDQLERESASSRFGAGCPAASKIGTVEAQTPLLEEKTFRGSLFVAEPFENPFDSLLALYMVVKDPQMGINLVFPAEVEPDPRTGQIITTFDELIQMPISSVRVRLREGGRSPLITPRRCGDYEVEAVFTPWAQGVPAHRSTSSFEIDGGPRGEGCAPRTPPFEPGFAAGTLNNAAGAHSPFLMRLTRRDGDQDLTRFDAVLPQGLVARLAGVPWCPEPAIARAVGREGKDELARPSCPAASRIGTVRGGAGAGSQLTYVPGKVYLAGPVGTAPLSVVAIVPAVAGPFDVGTIVVRQALDVDPRSAEVKVNGALSDPIPHILAGIPLSVRDIQVAIDRPLFTLNPTNCNPMGILAGIWGGGSHVFSAADDFPVLRQAPFQAAGCAALGFEPRLGIRLKGGTRRGGHPALRATYVPKPGDANLRRMALTFPRSAFVENANFRTICTRVQYAANACPPGSVYGQAKAWTPLLDAPLQGPVYLRSSNNPLPDAVFDLRGIVDAEVSVRIDSVRGRLRATVANAPDVPVSRVVVQMQGARKGLFVNSRNICRGANRARVNLTAQSAKREVLNPRFRAQGCNKAKKRAKRGRAGR